MRHLRWTDEKRKMSMEQRKRSLCSDIEVPRQASYPPLGIFIFFLIVMTTVLKEDGALTLHE